MGRRKANTLIRWTEGHTMLMFNKESLHLWIISDKSITVINFLLKITRIAIEPCCFSTLFHHGAYHSTSFQIPAIMFVSNHDMVSWGSIISLDSNVWWVTRCGQSDNIVLGEKRHGIRKRIRGTTGYFVRAGTITNGHGKDIQIWDTTINSKRFLKQSYTTLELLFSFKNSCRRFAL